MLFLLLDPLVLMLIMYLVARHDADLSFPKIFIICFILSLLVMSASFLIGIFSLLIYAAFLPLGLVQFCYLRWKTAFLVFGIFIVVKITLVLGLLFLMSR